jgi:ElaB/YqjD/DUF883 family membrane-anchored ribosome-binding protein
VWEGETTVTETTYGSLASEARRTAATAAEGLADASSRASEDLASRATAVGEQAVDKLHAAAEYFREHEVNEMVSDLQSYVKSHPTQALLGAAALGFLAAVLLRRH